MSLTLVIKLALIIFYIFSLLFLVYSSIFAKFLNLSLQYSHNILLFLFQKGKILLDEDLEMSIHLEENLTVEEKKMYPEEMQVSNFFIF